MVFKKSEYQNQFKSSVIAKNQATYEENLTFRHERRDREFIHTPIGWYDHQAINDIDSSDDEVNENTNNSNCLHEVTKKEKEPEYQSLAEIIDQSKAKSIAFRQQKKGIRSSHVEGLPDVLTLGKISLKDSCENVTQKDLVNNGLKGNESVDYLSTKLNGIEDEVALVKDDDVQQKLKSKSNLRKRVGRKEKSPQASHLYHSRPASAQRLKGEDNKCQSVEPSGYQIPALPIKTRPRRPDRQGCIPRANSRPVSHEDRPPFLAYGAGDKEDTFTTHRTHNVRSTVDVYAPALKAKMRREEEKKRQLARQKRLTQSTNDILDKLSSATPRDNIDYRSEYQKQFHGYEPKEYERATSSRAIITHSIPIRAVHRGGGLIVHVN